MFTRTKLTSRLAYWQKGRANFRLGWGAVAPLLVWQFTLVLASCAQPARQQGSSTPPAADRPSVVATNTVLCDLTQQIAGNTIDLTCLLDYGQDPHVYKPSPSDRVAIDGADLILYGGYQFEPSVIGMIKATPNSAPKVAVYEEAVPQPILSRGHDHEHEHEEEHAHEETKAEDEKPDPHVWQSAANNGVIATVLADHLSKTVPANASQYVQAAASLESQFAQLDQWIRQQVNTVPPPNRTLVTTHDAFRYFAEAYDFKVGGVLSGLSTAEKPSAATLTALVKEIKSAKVPAVFAESTTNPRLIETVAKDAGVEVVSERLYDAGPGGPGTDGATVQAMLVTNTCTIVNALGGKCDPQSAPSQASPPQ
ncbi:MAG TPA: zinc ABC transporter substrate-binding protein [Leptolyngbyaceae cyanobacterium]